MASIRRSPKPGASPIGSRACPSAPINSAIIAGNGPEKRLEQAFWTTISGRKIWAYTPERDIFRDVRKQNADEVINIFGLAIRHNLTLDDHNCL